MRSDQRFFSIPLVLKTRVIGDTVSFTFVFLGQNIIQFSLKRKLLISIHSYLEKILYSNPEIIDPRDGSDITDDFLAGKRNY